MQWHVTVDHTHMPPWHDHKNTHSISFAPCRLLLRSEILEATAYSLVITMMHGMALVLVQAAVVAGCAVLVKAFLFIASCCKAHMQFMNSPIPGPAASSRVIGELYELDRQGLVMVVDGFIAS